MDINSIRNSDGGSGSTSNQPRSRTQESTDRIVTGASDTVEQISAHCIAHCIFKSLTV